MLPLLPGAHFSENVQGYNKQTSIKLSWAGNYRVQHIDDSVETIISGSDLNLLIYLYILNINSKII